MATGLPPMTAEPIVSFKTAGTVARMLDAMTNTRTGVLAGVLGSYVAITGVTHFTKPGYHRRLVPHWLPAPRLVVAASGVLDCSVGLLMLHPRTRRAGGWSTAALITAYLPAHLDPLRTRGERPFLDRPAGVALRVLVNLGYITAAIAIGRAGGGDAPRPRR